MGLQCTVRTYSSKNEKKKKEEQKKNKTHVHAKVNLMLNLTPLKQWIIPAYQITTILNSM